MNEGIGYAKVVFGVIVGLALGIVIGMWFPPSTFKIPDACTSQAFWCWLDRWQTLVTGIVAFCVGYLTLRPLIQSQRREARLEAQNAKYLLARIQAECIRFEYGYLDPLRVNRSQQALLNSVSSSDFQTAIRDICDLHADLKRDTKDALVQSARMLELSIPEVHRSEIDPLASECVKMFAEMGRAASFFAQKFETVAIVAFNAKTILMTLRPQSQALCSAKRSMNKIHLLQARRFTRRLTTFKKH